MNEVTLQKMVEDFVQIAKAFQARISTCYELSDKRRAEKIAGQIIAAKITARHYEEA